MTSTSGILEFSVAQTFDYDLMVGGEPTGLTRLPGEGFGPNDNVSSNFIDELAAFTLHGGIFEANNGSGVFLDAGYSALNDGFEWGRIDFNVVGTGSTTITGKAGDGLIVNGNSIVDAAFTTATINSKSSLIVGDINCDGLVNLLDVDPFVDLLSNNEFEPKADINQDGELDLLDVAPFVNLLSSS